MLGQTLIDLLLVCSYLDDWLKVALCGCLCLSLYIGSVGLLNTIGILGSFFLRLTIGSVTFVGMFETILQARIALR